MCSLMWGMGFTQITVAAIANPEGNVMQVSKIEVLKPQVLVSTFPVSLAFFVTVSLCVKALPKIVGVEYVVGTTTEALVKSGKLDQVTVVCYVVQDASVSVIADLW